MFIMLTLLLITFFTLFLDFSSTLSRNLNLSDFLQRGFAIQCFNVNETPSKQSKIKKCNLQVYFSHRELHLGGWDSNRS